MTVYRISKAAFVKDLEGIGAKLFGGRWNHIGLPCIYAAESRALCVLEYAANTSLRNMPENLCLAALQISETTVLAVDKKILPANWKIWPHPQETQNLGSKWLNDKEYLVIKIPSVIIPAEYNYLINPLHADIKKIKIKAIEDYFFDMRIKK